MEQQRKTKMLTRKSILTIGVVDIIEILVLQDRFDIKMAANYEEATEILKEQTFSHVITDAALPERKSGLDVLRFVERERKKKAVKTVVVVVCHTNPTCPLGKREWIIEQSLRIHYPNDTYHEGTIVDYMKKVIQPYPACA